MFKLRTGETLFRRNAKLEDLESMEHLARQAGFPFGIHNLRLCYAISPDTWYLITNEAGDLIAWNTHNRLPLEGNVRWGFTVYVLPEYRGHGFMRRFDSMHYSPYSHIFNGSPDTIVVYKRSKFADKLLGYYGTGLCGNEGSGIRPENEPDFQMDSITLENFNLVANYDKLLIGFDRSKFLTEWILPNMYPCRAFGVVAHEQGRPCGYGALRTCSNYMITSLYADNDRVAEWLFYSLFKQLDPAEQIFLLFPAKNRLVLRLVHRMKLACTAAEMRELFGKFPEKLPWNMSKAYSLHEYYPL